MDIVAMDKNKDSTKRDTAILDLPLEHPLRDAVAEALAGEYGQGPRFMGTPPSMVLAAVTGSALAGFGIFHDMRAPDAHHGTTFDIEATRQLLKMEEVGLFRIALLHSLKGPDHLGTLTEQLLDASEEILASKYANHALMIPLMKKANEPAFDLWRQLGFKERGLSSYCLETALAPHAASSSPVTLPEGIDIRFMDGMKQLPRRAIAQCYARVFLKASELDAADKMVTSVLSSPGFSPELSMLARRRSSGRVVGFLLAEELLPQKVNITVVGFLKKYRSKGLPFYGFPRFASRCLSRGIGSATQMTSTERVVRLVTEYLGGSVTDEMVWMIRAR
jgi:hypothetical protein